MLPTDPSMEGAAAGSQLDALRDDPRPKLVLWADDDPVLPLEHGRRLCDAIGAGAPEVVANAGHFLQEDPGAEIGLRLAQWMRS